LLPRVEILEARWVPSTLTSPQRQLNPLAPYFAVGGAPGHVQVRRIIDGSLKYDFTPFGPGYTGSISVAVGDVNHDGFDDLIAGTATGVDLVKAFNGQPIANGTFLAANPDTDLLVQFSPYGAQFNVGVNVAAGDISGNGFADIVTGPTAGNPDVRVFSGLDVANGTFNPTGASLLAQWFPYALNDDIGANVGAGDVSRDGFADVVTGPTAGNPDVRVYNGFDIARRLFFPATSSLLAQFFAYGLQDNVGAYVAVGDTNADGYGNVITGATAGNPDVHVYDGRAIALHTFNPQVNLLTHFFAFDLGQDLGVTVGSADFLDAFGAFDILTGNSRTAPNYRLVRGNAVGTKPPAAKGIEGLAASIAGGIFVGA
jgi:hypothetical protein